MMANWLLIHDQAEYLSFRKKGDHPSIIIYTFIFEKVKGMNWGIKINHELRNPIYLAGTPMQMIKKCSSQNSMSSCLLSSVRVMAGSD